jgi:hypothetical protein
MRLRMAPVIRSVRLWCIRREDASLDLPEGCTFGVTDIHDPLGGNLAPARIDYLFVHGASGIVQSRVIFTPFTPIESRCRKPRQGQGGPCARVTASPKMILLAKSLYIRADTIRVKEKGREKSRLFGSWRPAVKPASRAFSNSPAVIMTGGHHHA